MSLCNTFRLSVACCIIVLSNIDAPVVALPLHRARGAIHSDRHLAQEESVQLEVKRELNVPDTITLDESTTTANFVNNDSSVPTNPSLKVEQVILKEPHTEKTITEETTNIPNVTLFTKQTDEEKGVTSDGFEHKTTNSELQTVTTGTDLEYTTSALVDKVTDTETTTSYIDVQTTSKIKLNDSETTELAQLEPSDPNKTTTQDDIKIKEKLLELEKLKNKIKVYTSRPMPKWKKYKIIERKRPSHSSEENVKEEKRKETEKEDILKAETQHVRVTMRDPATSEIPSIESSTPNFQATESEDGVTFIVTEQSASTTVSLTPSISPTETVLQISHESKRAGFLNYSGKIPTEEAPETTTIDVPSDTTTIQVITQADNSDLKTNEQRISVTESPIEDKKNIESRIVLNEDAIKEELLKEELINNNKDNAKRQREEAVNNKSDLTEAKNVNSENSAETNSSSEISAKQKNITLYTVSPNYKPMKKIEVLPPKQFVRDPDDNSWRNESLSSLGIVFKPKNSSKPFTQVLKNKTETEWNNLSEKDSKNELPDLKERLQKEAQKRKSKRKKTDSLGNVVYFDYEENSNSAEHAGATIDSRSSIATTYSPTLQSTIPENISPQEALQNTTKNVTSTLTTEGIHKHRFTTSIPMFLHEYYDSTDEDDSDYLNMAQIDLKKFTTSLRTSAPFHTSTTVAKQRDWLKQNKVTHNAFPERKATVQYFPPRTTQRVNVNDYDNGFKFKMESFTTESVAPKLFSPASEAPTTPVTVNTVSSTADYTKNLLLTQPQITTEAGLPLNDGNFDRGTYVIKHYKDFVDEAAKHSEYDKNIGYIPYTEAPVEGVTKPQLIEYETEKPRAIDGEYDYEAQFRKDVLQRFVDNFNQNREQYRSDYPILFNSSIIHGGMHNNGDIASSRAFMRGSYNNDIFKPKFTGPRKACEPNCDKLTVELSPAYELHYYVPDEEEKEEVQPVTLPYQYR